MRIAALFSPGVSPAFPVLGPRRKTQTRALRRSRRACCVVVETAWKRSIGRIFACPTVRANRHDLKRPRRVPEYFTGLAHQTHHRSHADRVCGEGTARSRAS